MSFPSPRISSPVRRPPSHVPKSRASRESIRQNLLSVVSLSELASERALGLASVPPSTQETRGASCTSLGLRHPVSERLSAPFSAPVSGHLLATTRISSPPPSISARSPLHAGRSRSSAREGHSVGRQFTSLAQPGPHPSDDR